jgi:hypothetical protein
VDNPSSARTWAPKLEIVVLAWAAAVGMAAMAVLTDDLPGRVLLGVAAAGLALAGLFGTVARPRLAADGSGVTVRGLTGSRRWDWAEVTVRVVRNRRLGRDTTAVELDAGDADLVVLGWLDLGADPEDVVEALHQLPG